MQLLNQKYPALTDDSVIIKKEAKKFFFYQSHLIEKEWWIKRNSDKYDIAKIFFIKKSKQFKIEKIENKEYILDNLFRQFYTQDKNHVQKQMKYLLEFVNEFDDFYNLYFVKDENKLIKILSG